MPLGCFQLWVEMFSNQAYCQFGPSGEVSILGGLGNRLFRWNKECGMIPLGQKWVGTFRHWSFLLLRGYMVVWAVYFLLDYHATCLPPLFL